MALTFNHQTNDISNATGTVTFNGVAVGGDNTPPVWFGSRGVFAGGWDYNNRLDVIDYIAIDTTGNATDFGNLLAITGDYPAGISNTARGVVGGGDYASGATNVIQYITVASTGNATDFGDLTVARENMSAVGNGTRGVFGGGRSGATVMDYITIANTGNATDFGDMLASGYEVYTGAGGSTRGIFAGGYDYAADAATDTIQYITIATTGNATDFGNLIAADYGMGGFSNATRCVFGGGYAGGFVNRIQYITTATTGNATDFGDLTRTKAQFAGAANGTRGVFGGGLYAFNSSSVVNEIEYITIASTGNATDFGDLTVARYAHAGLSGT